MRTVSGNCSFAGEVNFTIIIKIQKKPIRIVNNVKNIFNLVFFKTTSKFKDLKAK